MGEEIRKEKLRSAPEICNLSFVDFKSFADICEILDHFVKRLSLCWESAV